MSFNPRNKSKSKSGSSYDPRKDGSSNISASSGYGLDDLISDGHKVLTDVYEDTFDEDTRMILDPIIDSIPIIGDGRDMMDEFLERRDYLEKTGIGYDEIYDKQNWNAGISRNLEKMGGSVRGVAGRGSKSIQEVYSR